MATIYREGDLDLLSGKVDGIGSKAAAEDAGLGVRSIPDAVRGAQVVALLLPDHVQKQVWDEQVAPNLDDGAAVLFAHGLNIHFGRIAPPEGHDVIMVAPKAP